MIILYKKSSESTYKELPASPFIFLTLEAAVSYDFIIKENEAVYWSLYDQKNNPVYRNVYKKGTPLKLTTSSQFAGKATVYLIATSAGKISGITISSQAQKLIKESSWMKLSEGKTNIKNIRNGAAYGEILILKMLTWGLNGEEVVVEIREYVDTKTYHYVAEYPAKVVNGEIYLLLLDTRSWQISRKTGCYYVLVKLKGNQDYILDSGNRNYHANYLYLENRAIYEPPKPKIPNNQTATTVPVPKQAPGDKKYVFYYKGTKKWGQLQKYDKNGELDIGVRYDRLTEQELNDHATEVGKYAYNTYSFSLEATKMDYEYTAGVRVVVSGDIADRVINNFYHGNGRKLSFKGNEKIEKDLKKYPYFQQYFKNYLEVIKYMLKEKTIQTKDREEIIQIFRDNIHFEYTPDFSIEKDILTYDFYGIMGGTQTVKVDLEIEEQFPGTYKVKTEMYIGDWYGADWDDLNGTGMKKYAVSLKAFFVLQHYFGCRPFETEIYYKSTDYITL